LCTHDGPNEMLSQLKLEFVDASTPVTATLNFDGSGRNRNPFPSANRAELEVEWNNHLGSSSDRAGELLAWNDQVTLDPVERIVL